MLRLKRCVINKIIQIFNPKKFFLCHLVNFHIGGYFNINRKLIEKQRHKNVSMYTVRVSLTKSEQVFLCCNQLNSFNGTDLPWALRVGRRSFVQSDYDISRFHLSFLKF